jgi:outer membrane protein OmpA-like peptidoglycan-associated protein
LDIIRKILKPVVWMLAFHLLMLSGPYHSAWAAIISTEATIDLDRAERMRNRLSNYLMREDIKAILESRGIEPAEVQTRMDSLTDTELEQIADQIDQLPAGSGFFEAFLIIIFLVFVVLLFTDIAGYTDVFPFVNKQAAANTSRAPAAVKTSEPAQAPPAQSVSGINPETPLIVLFNPNSNDLTANAYERLDRVALFMVKNPQTKISVIGFSDATGTSSYDQMVSEVRANTVKNYLIAKGVAPSKISTAAGGTHAASNPTNSRVVIEFK